MYPHSSSINGILVQIDRITGCWTPLYTTDVSIRDTLPDPCSPFRVTGFPRRFGGQVWIQMHGSPRVYIKWDDGSYSSIHGQGRSPTPLEAGTIPPAVLAAYEMATDAPPAPVAEVVAEPLAARHDYAAVHAALPISDSDSEYARTNARDLHKFLGVGKDFSTWIKDRIASLQLVEGKDYDVVKDLSSPNLGSSKARPQKRREYLLSLDAAAVLAQKENTEAGLAVSWYFTEWRNRTAKMLATPDVSVFPKLPDFTDPLAAAEYAVAVTRKYIESTRAARALEAHNATLVSDNQEAAAYSETLIRKIGMTGETVKLSEFARLYHKAHGYTAATLFGYLYRKSIIFQRKGTIYPRADLHAAGVFDVTVRTYQGHATGDTSLTPYGVEWLLSYMAKDNDTLLNRMLLEPGMTRRLASLRGSVLHKSAPKALARTEPDERTLALFYSPPDEAEPRWLCWGVWNAARGKRGAGSTLREAILELAGIL